jgi:hypothetical protein
MATIHRQVSAIALEQGWEEPSYAQVYRIVKELSPALVTLAHEGAGSYREEYELLYRREAGRANEMRPGGSLFVTNLGQRWAGQERSTVVDGDRGR